MKKIVYLPDDHIKGLRLIWKTERGIWKCICNCGHICYVKETALWNHLVGDCGCGCGSKYTQKKIKVKIRKQYLRRRDKAKPC